MKKLTLILIVLLTCHNLTGQNKPLIPADKQLHLIAGAATSLSTHIAKQVFTGNQKNAFWYGAGASLLAGVGKELYDQSKGAKFDVKDVAATFAGGILISLPIEILKRRKSNKKKLF